MQSTKPSKEFLTLEPKEDPEDIREFGKRKTSQAETIWREQWVCETVQLLYSHLTLDVAHDRDAG